MAFGIQANSSSASARLAPLGAMLGAAAGKAWRLLCGRIARRRELDALARLDDRLLRDIGVLRDRDIGLERRAAADKLFWRL
jgi:uncharacterized protein YjiS (DUF1127 family)